MTATGERAGTGLLSALAIAYGEIGVTDRAARLADAAAHVGRPLTSTKELGVEEASWLRRHLRRCTPDTCRFTTAVRLQPAAPSELPTTAQEETVVICTHDGTVGHPWRPGEGCPDALAPGVWSVRPAPPADAPEQQDDEVDQLIAVLLRLLTTVQAQPEPITRAHAKAAADVLLTEVPALTSRRPAVADQQRREQVARWLWDWKWNDVNPDDFPWDELHPIQREGYRRWADELLSLLSAAAGPADQDGER